MRRWLWALALATVVRVPQPARADTVDVLADFGLLGTWSENCRGLTDLIRFNISSLGPQVNVGKPERVQYSATIESAVQGATDEVTLYLNSGLAAARQTVTLRLRGGKLQVWQSEEENMSPDIADGRITSTGASTPVLVRCVSE